MILTLGCIILGWLECHSVKISGFFCHSDFSWNQIWRIKKFYNCRFYNFWGSGFWYFGKYQTSNVEKADFAPVESQKLISHKIWVIEKLCNFHTVNVKRICSYFKDSDLVWLNFKHCMQSTYIQCGNFMSFLSLGLYVKSMFLILEGIKLAILTHLEAPNLNFYDSLHFF